VFTDGDLRRLLERGQDFTKVHRRRDARPAAHHQPGKAGGGCRTVMEQFRINQLLVTDADGVLTGALHIHDLTRAKVI
jgi:arabinose-5-phosphate isomerase